MPNTGSVYNGGMKAWMREWAGMAIFLALIGSAWLATERGYFAAGVAMCLIVAALLAQAVWPDAHAFLTSSRGIGLRNRLRTLWRRQKPPS